MTSIKKGRDLERGDKLVRFGMSISGVWPDKPGTIDRLYHFDNHVTAYVWDGSAVVRSVFPNNADVEVL